ncbi:MAG: ABC transporter substrate-binding protein [Lachnospiraceae bacterium]|nr:ABC transporter substrate-binding protein [Lachnospiraceae bacterium]
MYKKTLSLFIICCLISCLFIGCSTNDNSSTDEKKQIENSTDETQTSANINIGCMKGPTAIGMIKLLSDSDNSNTQNSYNYTIAGTADEISTGLINGSLDIAAVPSNLASVLYNKTNGEIVTVAVNTLGVLYIVETGDTIHEVSDLKGKTIYSTGQGTTPEYTLRFLLSSSGLNPDEDVTVEYKSEASEVVATLSQNPDAVAMLPQPYVTIALSSIENLRIALDVTKEWEENADGTVVTGVIVARKSFIEENEVAFKNFLTEYEASTMYANSNIDETATLLEEYDVFKAAIAKQAIPYCNVTYLIGNEMKDKVISYLTVLYEQNPAAIGGKLPEEGMFYIGNN